MPPTLYVFLHECAHHLLGHIGGIGRRKPRHVEQKNWMHVRKVVGYRRFDTPSELRLLNEIYSVLRLYKNFCLPTMRLQSKTREQGRIKGCTRNRAPLTNGSWLSRRWNAKPSGNCQDIYEGLNPAQLHRRLTELREQWEIIIAGKSEGY